MEVNIPEKRKHFAVVVCDSHPKYGDEESIGKRHKDLFANQDGDEEWRIFACPKNDVPTPEDLDKFHGFVFTGGRYSVYDDYQWIRDLEEFIQASVKLKKKCPKVVGLCWGHQLFAKALGGEVSANPSGKFIVGVEKVMFDPELRHQSYFRDVKFDTDGSVYISQSHGECVIRLPPDAQSLARSQSCEHEVVQFSENVLGIQGHPNISLERMRERVIPAVERSGGMTEQEKRVALESLNPTNNNAEVLGGLKLFLES